MTRIRIYTTAFSFLIIAVIMTFLLAILVEQFNGLKILDPISQIALLGPAMAAFLMTLLNRKNSLKDLNFNKINVHVLYVILVYLFYAIILALTQIIFGNMSFEISSNEFYFYGETIGFERYFFKAGLLTIIFSGFGEEIGWRGFLFNKLKTLPFFEMTILLNVIWALWHLPMFILGGMGHSNLLISFTLFVIISIEFGIMLNYIRLKTNSVFGAILVHPVANISSWLIMGYTRIDNEFWASHPNIIAIVILFPISLYYYKKGQKLYYDLN